nr:2-vinyl bacteriochlorophyllide hydratase [Altererythrobacter lutimaris]
MPRNTDCLIRDPKAVETASSKQLYTDAERERRDASKWTLVQGILAPVQFVIFLASLGLVLRYLATGDGMWLADASIVAKTLALYTIMVTGAIWEKDVFGQYLFVPAFFWEDVFSMLVLALHTAYLVMLFAGLGSAEHRMYIALAAYLAYVINAGQFLLKLRAARLEAPKARPTGELAVQG